MKVMIKSQGKTATEHQTVHIRTAYYEAIEFENCQFYQNGVLDTEPSFYTDVYYMTLEKGQWYKEIRELTDYDWVRKGEIILEITVDGEQIYKRKIIRDGIKDLGLSLRAYKCLERAGVKTIYEISQKTEDELKRIPNLGKHSLKEIKDVLKEYGLSLKEI